MTKRTADLKNMINQRGMSMGKLLRYCVVLVMLGLTSWSGEVFAQATQVRVEVDSTGIGGVVPAQNLSSGDTLRVYAIARTATGVFVANVPATWSLDSLTGGVVSGDLVPSADGKSAKLIGRLVGSAKIRAASGLLTQVPSGRITVVPGTATRLRISQEPSTIATAGIPFAQQPIVRVEDANGNLVTGDNTTVVTARRLLGTGTLQGDTSRIVSGGLATFTGLRHNVAGTINIRFTSSSALTPDTSINITVNPGAAARLAFIQQPTNDTAGTIITPAITIQVRDTMDNNVGGVRSVTMAIDSGTGVLSGTTTLNTNASGLATFSNLSINLAGTKKLKATSVGLDSAVSVRFVISPAAASRLRIQTQPSPTATAGVVFAQQPVVRIEDQFGNLITTDNTTQVTAARAAGAGTLQGTTVRTASSGLVTFTDLRHLVAGTITIRFTSTPVLTPDTSNSILINPAAPKKLVFIQQPTNDTAGTVITPAPTVQLQDTFSNNVPQSGVLVAMALSFGTGTLSGTTSQNTNASGLATFNNLSINLVGRKVLTASSSGLVSAVSDTFTISPGPPASIVASTGTPQSALVNTTFATRFEATVRDAQGNLVPGRTVTFSAPTTGPRGTFQGGFSSINVTTDSVGVARATPFTANTVAGSYNVSATVAGVATPALFSLTNTPGPPRQIAAIAGTPQSTQIATAFPVNFKAAVSDTFGNRLSNVMVRFTRPSSSGPSGSFHNNIDSALTDTGGVATAVIFTANIRAGSYAVTASAQGVLAPAAFNLTNLPGPPEQIAAIAGTPQSAQVGTAFATRFKASVRDGANNPIPNLLVRFTKPATGPSGTFAGGIDTVRTDSVGIATAPVFTANLIAGSYNDSAIVTGLSTPAIFQLTNLPGPPGSISIVAGNNQTATVNTNFGTNFQVIVRDSANNPIPDTTVTFTAPSTGPSGKFGTSRIASVRTNASGVATAPTFTADTLAGSYQVSASAPGVATPAVFSLRNLAGPSARIEATAGTPQQAQIGNPFTILFRARVTDQFYNPKGGIVVTWTRPTSGPTGTFRGNVNTATTDSATGVAVADTFTANFTAGSYVVKASAPGVSDSASFFLTNNAGAPRSIAAAGGFSQTTRVNTPFLAPLLARVEDLAGNPVPNVAVTFTAPVTNQSGKFVNDSTTYTVNTNASGYASTTVRANTIAGLWVAEARVSGVTSPAIFNLTNQPTNPASVTVTQGNDQSAVVNETYQTNFAVTVRDTFGNATPGILIRFIRPTTGPSGSFAGGIDTSRTNPSGEATAVPFRANTIAGAFKVAATVGGGTPMDSIRLTNRAAAPKTITVQPGTTPQETIVNTPFPTRLAVSVRDTFSNPVPSVTVTFNVPPLTGPSGTFAGGVNIAQTNAAGIAEAPVLTANGRAGTFTATATVSGVLLPAQFSLTNRPGAPWTITATAGTPQSAQVTTIFPDTMKALVRDSSGNPVPDIDVQFIPPDTGATGSFLGSNVQRTGSNGVAVAPAFVANFRAGSYVVQARVGSLTPATYSLRNTPALPRSVSVAGGTNQATTVGTQFPLPLQAQVRDQYGNPVPDRQVTFTSPSTGPSCNFPSSGIGTATTDQTGIATIVAVANTEAGSYDVRATVTGTSDSATFRLTNNAAAPSTMTIRAGNQQSAQVGTRFLIDLEVTVRDGFANVVPNALVSFTPPSSGPSGTFQGGIDTVRSGANGVARAMPFTANSIAGGPYQVTATALGGTNPAVIFELTNTSGPPGHITIQAGDVQSAQVNTPFAVRFRVRVRDADSNNVPNAPVQFSAPPGGASGTFPGGVTGVVVNTDAAGIAVAPEFTANTRAGRYTVSATAPGVANPASFQLTNLPAPAVHLQSIAGTPQETQVSTAFPVNFKTKVLDQYFNPVPRALVRWIAPPQTGPSGTFVAGIDTARTDDSTGIATATVFVANAIAGQYQVKAVSPNVPDTARYDLRNRSGPAASIAAEGGTPQTTRVNTIFASRFTVSVRDLSQNPVENALVRFTYPNPQSGPSGTFENGIDTVRTNSAGIATSARFLANTQVGQYVVRASTDGVSHTAAFNLTNIATSPMSITMAGGSPQSAQVNTLFALRLRASVRDTFNNPIPNLNVTFEPPSSGPSGSFEGGNTVTTNDSGLATANPFRANSTAGSYVVRASAQGLNAAVNYDLTNTTGAPGNIVIIAGRQQSAVVNTVFDTAFSVRVTDGFGNPVSGVDIAFTAPSSGASGSFAGGATSTVVQTNTAGIATAGAFRANTLAGSYNLIASNPNIGAQAVFNLTNLTGPLNTFLVEAENGGAIGLQLAKVPFNVRISARDQYNNLITGYDSTVTITSTGTLLAGGGVTSRLTGGVLVHRIIIRNAGSNITITARQTTGGTQSGTSNAFQVNNPIPRIASVTPAQGALLDTIVLTLRGSHFIDSLVTSLNMGTNITVNSLVVDDTTQLRATVTIGVAADTGRRLISVSNAQPGGGPSNSVAFVIEVPLPRPPHTFGPPDSGRIYSPIAMLSWSSAPLAISYHLQVVADAGFGNIVFEDSTLTTTSIVLGPPTLQHGGTYFWRVRATNPRGTGAFSPTKVFSVSPVYPSGYSLNTTVAFPTRETPGDYLPTDYRLVGLPGDPSRNNIRLDQLLGGTQNVDWVVFRDNGAATNFFVAFSANDPLFNLTPGRAFWVLKRAPWTIANVAVPSAPLDTTTFSVSIPLQLNWNIITNPYSVPVTWNDVRTVNGIIDPIYGFSGTFQMSNVMQPYTGYYFFNAESLASLKIPYGSPAPSAINKPALARQEGEWTIGIAFTTGGLVDATTSLGVKNNATEGLDAFEYRKPRSFADLPAIYFHRPEWDATFSGFAVDYRPAVKELAVWPFDVHAPREQTCRLTFDGVADVPAHLQVYLLDELHGRYVDLRKESDYTFTLPMGQTTLKIVAGTEEAVREVLSSVLPKEFALGNNFPNPFNPATTIPIAVPHTADVSLKIYNILGQEVRTVYHGTLEPGRYYFVWDGKNDQGLSVATGAYISRFTTNVGKAFTRKMMLMK